MIKLVAGMLVMVVVVVVEEVKGAVVVRGVKSSSCRLS